MTVSLDDHLKKLTPERRARIEARTKELIEDELTLRDLRQAQHLTQERMAALMAVESGKRLALGTARGPSALDLEQLRRSDGRQTSAGSRIPEPAARRHRSGRYRRQCAARAETARP
jgi:hypothetical protein